MGTLKTPETKFDIKKGLNSPKEINALMFALNKPYPTRPGTDAKKVIALVFTMASGKPNTLKKGATATPDSSAHKAPKDKPNIQPVWTILPTCSGESAKAFEMLICTAFKGVSPKAHKT